MPQLMRLLQMTLKLGSFDASIMPGKILSTRRSEAHSTSIMELRLIRRLAVRRSLKDIRRGFIGFITGHFARLLLFDDKAQRLVELKRWIVDLTKALPISGLVGSDIHIGT